MIKLAISNQRGGVAKTTTAITLARCFADDGRRVLLIDTDMQGSIALTFNISKPKGWLSNLLIDGFAVESVATPLHPNIDLIGSDKSSVRVESELNTLPGREYIFQERLAGIHYDVVILDTSPSISNLHTVSISYASNVICPVGMDMLSLEGLSSSLHAIKLLNRRGHKACRCIGLLPTQVDKRFSMASSVMQYLKEFSQSEDIPILNPVRTDQSVNKSGREHRFLQDYDPRSKALEDYQGAFKQLNTLLESPHVEAEAIPAYAR